MRSRIDAGKFDLGLNGTYLFAYSQANTPGQPPGEYREHAEQSHQYQGQRLGIMDPSRFWRFHVRQLQNHYRDTLSVPNRGVSPWTTIDLQLSYETTGDTLGGWDTHNLR